MVAYFRQSERGDRAKKSKQETPAMGWGPGKGGGGTPHMKGVGMLVLSLRGVNFGFWSQGVLGKTPLYVAVKVSFRVAREKI